MTTEADYRLPRSVIPRHYRLTFEPDLEGATFRGASEVDVEVAEATSEIVLNAVDLAITNVRIVSGGGHEIELAGLVADADRERVTLRFADVIEPGAWRLHAEFDGVLNDALHGFYRSTYTAEDGSQRIIATTQFESTDARMAFPCWDEPDLKATFGVTLVIPEGLMAISNTAIAATSQFGDGKVSVRFEDTMVMSTYLVAMIVGDMEATEPVDVDGVPLRIVHVPGKSHLTPFALDAGAFALRYFAEYYDIPYPGGKLDMIGIPDFAWGAMENLGAITYRESALLVDDAVATQAEKARVADVIAHEIAHMWFGDLVTMKWWNGIWLNEAFASFMETKCVEAYRPDWKRWLSFTSTRAHSMDLDALASTRPIEIAVASPAEANQMFDALTYGKGQAVLRMLEVYLGEDVFRSGIASYLKKHAYDNTETSDLWAALEAESGEPVGDIMREWIFTGGFPRLTVTPDGESLRITQEHFRYLGSGDGSWRIPALYRSDDAIGRLLVDEEAIVVGERLMLNRRGQGFYRVHYASELFGGVIETLPGLEPEERSSVVSDAWANVLTGDAAAASFVDLVSGLGDEMEPAVWGVVLGGLTELDRVISSDTRPWLQGVVRDLVGPAVDRLGWEPFAGENDLVRQLRGLLVGALGSLGAHEPTRATARDVLERWLEARDAVDGEVGAAALSIVARTGGSEEFERFVSLYRSATRPQDEVRFLRAAISVPERDTAATALEMVLDGSVRSQDSPWVLAVLLGHRDTGSATWELMKRRWDDVLATPPRQTARRIIDLIPNRSEPDVASDIEDWLGSHPIPDSELYTAQQLERLAVRVALREREGPRLGPGR